MLSYLAELGYDDVLVLSNDGEALGVASSVAEIMRLADRDLYVDLLAIHRDRADARAALETLAERIGTNYRLRPLPA